MVRPRPIAVLLGAPRGGASRRLGRLVTAPALALALFAWAAGARADAAINVTATQVQVNFPSSVTFTLAATSSASITAVGLQVNTPGKTYGAIPLDVQPSFTSAPSVNATWTWSGPGPGASLPPGVEISYRWTVKDAAGGSLETPLKTVRYEDGRYAWKYATAPGIKLAWYEGDAAYGQQLLKAATDGLQALHEQQGVDLKADLSVYIYATQQALRGAMLGSPVWIGGRAYPEFNTILLIAEQADPEKGRKALVHEMTHQLVYQQTFNPLLGSHVPPWLNEGLAVTSEGPTSRTFADALKTAVNDDALPTLRTLDGNFPADPRASNVAYAESESAVRYLLKRYGAEKMRELLGVLQAGSRIDPALQKVYGGDLNQVQDAWRATLGARPLGHDPVAGELLAVSTVQPLSVPGRAHATSGRPATISPRLALLAGGFGALSLALIAALGLLIRALFRHAASPSSR